MATTPAVVGTKTTTTTTTSVGVAFLTGQQKQEWWGGINGLQMVPQGGKQDNDWCLAPRDNGKNAA